jgi:predicted dehydrogenase
MKLGLVGCGRVAELHGLAIEQSPRLELGGVFDINQELAQQRSKEWGTTHFPTLDAMLNDESVESVLILTHEDTHIEIARKSLSHGKHIYIEKPVSSHPEEVLLIEREAQSLGLVAMPGHNYAYSPEFSRLHRLVRNGDLGTIRSLHINYVIPMSEDVAQDYGGVLAEVMIHHIYMALCILGSPDALVAGIAKTAWKVHPAEDQAWMTLEYEYGASAHLFCSFATDDYSADPWTFMAKVLGTDGSASLTWRSSFFTRPLGTLTYALPLYEESFGCALEAFESAIRKGVSPISTLSDAACASRLIDLGYRSAIEKRFVMRRETEGGLW